MELWRRDGCSSGTGSGGQRRPAPHGRVDARRRRGAVRVTTQRRTPSGRARPPPGPGRRRGRHTGATRIAERDRCGPRPPRPRRPAAASRRTVNVGPARPSAPSHRSRGRSPAGRPSCRRSWSRWPWRTPIRCGSTSPRSRRSRSWRPTRPPSASRSTADAGELAKWKDPEYIKAQAREQLLLCASPGETPLLVLADPAGAARDAGQDDSPAEPPPDRWYDTLWTSVRAADAEPPNDD